MEERVQTLVFENTNLDLVERILHKWLLQERWNQFGFMGRARLTPESAAENVREAEVLSRRAYTCFF